jgi:nucleoside-diphosphate-sugar epimerase
VRALVRGAGSAVWLSRTAAELVPGDVTRPESLPAAVAGVDVVFHCAALLGGDEAAMERVNVEGTRALLDAALAAGVRRFVHVSTLAVMGHDLPDGVDEDYPGGPADTPYGRTKHAAEALVRGYHTAHGLGTVVLRPTIVYGPRSQWWTVDPVQRILKGRLALLGEGEGVANVVYVDDVVEAMVLAATRPGVEGRVYLVNGGERVTWRDFFGAYAAMAGRELAGWPVPVAEAVTSVTDGLDRTIGALERREATAPGFAAALGLRATRKLAQPLYKLYRGELGNYGSRAQVSIERARRELGYEPRYPLAAAMAETERWLRAQRYLPPGPDEAAGGSGQRNGAGRP